MSKMILTKIISGGQEGADRGGLEGAKRAQIPTGGTAPKGYRTEIGSDFSLNENYGLKEHHSRLYPPRTLCNVKYSNGTLLVGNTDSQGSLLTIKYCRHYKNRRPYIINPTPEDLAEFIIRHNVQVLNVAGNRESRNPSIFERTTTLIVDTVKLLRR